LHVDEVCTRFENAWKDGSRPQVEDFLGDTPEPARTVLVRELLAIESAYCRRQADTPGTDSDVATPTPWDNGSRGAAPRLPAARRCLGGYEVLEEIGRGGMGVVYKARQASLKRLVALKLLLAGEYAGPEQLARFRSETESVARLQHPNIVQIHEVGEADGHAFCALEFVAGGSLAARLAGTPMQPRQAAQLVQALALAMQAAHEAGVVHRDLKPANVLLTADGVPKVTDFGLARQLDAPSGQTQSGQVVGTPSYMPPEQAAGQVRQIGPASDVYALGAILYECLTGRPPFKAATALDTLMLLRTQDPVPPGQLQPHIPRDLETICLKCLEKEPRRRYATAKALAGDLGSYLRNEPITARPVGAPERLAKWARRRPAVAALSAGMLALAAVAFGLVTWQWLRAEGNAVEAGKRADGEKAARKVAEEERDRAQLLSARLAFARGLNMCEGGDVRGGLLWLARASQMAPATDPDLRDTIRTNLDGWGRQVSAVRAVLPNGGTVTVVAFSPDGATLATVSGEAVRLWESETGRLRGGPLQTGAPVRRVVFSPDGKVLAAEVSDRTVRLWDVATGKANGPPLRHQAPVAALAFSPDGAVLRTFSKDCAARSWRAATGEPLGDPLQFGKQVDVAAFSPDAQTILMGNHDRGIYLWDAQTGKAVLPPLQNPFHIGIMTFSPDGRTFVSAGVLQTGDQSRKPGKVQVWETATGKPVGQVITLGSTPNAVVFSPDSKQLLTCCSDGVAQRWDAATGLPLGEPLPHGRGVEAGAWSPDGGTVLTAPWEIMSVRLWDTATGQARICTLPHAARVAAAAFSPDGKAVLTGGADGVARLWEVGPADSLPISFPEPIQQVWLSPDAQTLLAYSGESVWLWDTLTGKPRGPALPHPSGITDALFSPDGRSVVATCGENLLDTMPIQLRGWDVATGRPLPALRTPKRAGSLHCWSPDGKRLLAIEGPDALLIEAETGKAIGRELSHPPMVRTAVFSPDGRTAATGGDDGAARLWDVDTGRAIGGPLRHEGTVQAIAFSPDGKQVLTGGVDRTVRRWDVTTGRQLGEPLRHQGTIVCVAFSPDGETILTASVDRAARLWRAADGRPLGEPMRHQGTVAQAAFSPDGKTVLTAGRDKTARVWDAVTGQPLSPLFRHAGEVQAAAFLPDGRGVLTVAFTRDVDRSRSIRGRPGEPRRVVVNWELSVRRWPLPGRLTAPAGQVERWAEAVTGMALDTDGVAGLLDADAWQERRGSRGAPE
jgi:WD40 repeat protein